MKKVKLLTEDQKDLLAGAELRENHKFNPQRDADNNWIISIRECDLVENENFMWVKDLPEIDFNPKIEEIL